MGRLVEVYDTTLRDGAQTRGISFSSRDKVRIAGILDELGVRFIEAGWPGSNPKDVEVFRRLNQMKLKNAQIAAFSMTCRKGIKPEDDPNFKALLEAKTPIVTIVGKSSKLQVERVLGISLEENLGLIKESCAFLTSQGRKVFYDAEHFFDGFKQDSAYAFQTLLAAEEGGAERIILCDTNGGTLPFEVAVICEEVFLRIKKLLGIHTHNDAGVAVANTIEAVRHGVFQVQGTINGYGERCGNADLCSVIPDLQIKMGYDCLSPKRLSRLSEVSHLIAEIANLPHNSSQPYVGTNAFSHKGGMHADAMRKWEESYQHVEPALVGGKTHIVGSELSGRANISSLADKFGVVLSTEQIREVLAQIKELENQGFYFEEAEASLELLMRKARSDYILPFEVLNFSAIVGNGSGNTLSQVLVKIKIREEIVVEGEEGDGPVHALDRALRKCLLSFFPELKKVRLEDYKVRILDGKAGTASWVRVLIDFSSGQNIWTTVGASTNIIEASLKALADGLEYAILKAN